MDNTTHTYKRPLINGHTVSSRKGYSTYFDVIKILTLIFMGSISIYYIKLPIVRTFYYISILSFYFLSKRDEMWIPLLFFMCAPIFQMFSQRPYVWIVELTPTVGVSWWTAMPLVIFAKYYNRKYNDNKIEDLVRKKYSVYAFYAVFLILWGTLLYRHSAASVLMTWNCLTIMLMFFYLRSAFTYQKLLHVSSIIFVFSIVIVVINTIELIMGNIITYYFTFGAIRTLISNIEGEEFMRRTLGTFVSYYALIMSLFYIANKRNDFNYIYLIIVSALSWFNILNSGTRGWMLSTIVLMFMYMLLYSRKILTMLFVPKIVLSLVFIATTVYLFIPAEVTRNLRVSFDRFATLEAVVYEGDMTAGGTVGRWDQRGPRVLTRFSESPIFGFGYSRVMQEYWDGHVGNHVLLLEGGIVGMIVVYLTVMLLIYYFIKQEYKGVKGAGVFGLSLISIMVIHSTSRNMISFRLAPNTAMLLCLLFAHYNAYMDLLKKNKK